MILRANGLMSETAKRDTDSLRVAVIWAVNIADELGETLIAAKLSDLLDLIGEKPSDPCSRRGNAVAKGLKVLSRQVGVRR
jgi:hypothetical protein